MTEQMPYNILGKIGDNVVSRVEVWQKRQVAEAQLDDKIRAVFSEFRARGFYPFLVRGHSKGVLESTSESSFGGNYSFDPISKDPPEDYTLVLLANQPNQTYEELSKLDGEQTREILDIMPFVVGNMTVGGTYMVSNDGIIVAESYRG